MRYEPACAAQLREDLKSIDPVGLELPAEALISLVSVPDAPPVDDVEVIDVDKVELVAEAPRDYSICAIDNWLGPESMGTTTLSYELVQETGDVRVVSYAEHRPRVMHEGLKFSPDMSLMRNAAGDPIRVHTGTATLFDIVQQVSVLDKDYYVLSYGGYTYRWLEEDPGFVERFIASHKRSGALVTCVVQPRFNESDNRPGLVWSGGRAVMYDYRDIEAKPQAMEVGLYIVSNEVFKRQIPWTWKKRRIHNNGKIWFQWERDLCQLTREFETNYVRLN